MFHVKIFNVSRFSKCIGAVDCSYVKIQSPGGEEPELFRNTKSWFFLNVQAICDPDLVRIRNIVARWPESTHDSTIFNNSAIRRFKIRETATAAMPTKII